jgi:hypothetical protein
MMKHWDLVQRRLVVPVLHRLNGLRTSEAQLAEVQAWLDDFENSYAKYEDFRSLEGNDIIRAELLQEIEWLKQGNMNFPDDGPIPKSNAEFYTPTPREG